MGKTRTAVISDAPDSKPKKKERKKHRKSLRETKGIKIPGLKGGERIVAIDSELIPEEERVEKKKEKKEAGLPKIRGKKYQDARGKIDREKLYKIADAVKLIKQTSYSSFDATVEAHLVVKKVGTSMQLKLPHSTGKVKKIEIADKKTIENLEKGKIDFDILLATAEMMPKLVPYAKLLGPKGLMPNPKNETIIKNAKEKKKFLGNKITIKTEKRAPLIHLVIGKVSQKDSEITENIEAILKVLGKKQVIKAYLTSTMGPSVKLDLSI